MDNISYEEFQKKEEYSSFLKENPSLGNLKVISYNAYMAMPIENTHISITKQIGDYNVLFYEGYTNSSGMIDDIFLPAPVEEIEATYENRPKYTLYELLASKEGFETIKKDNIGMFGGVKVIQNIKMIPIFSGGDQ